MKEKPNLSSSQRFRSALDYATTLHATQYRKGTDIPYISHLYSVAALVMEAEGTEDEVIGALLHDAAEDQGGQEVLDTIRDRFGNKAADIVAGCTDDMPGKGEAKKPWWERKQAYIAHLQDSSHSVRLVSNADKLHNARCIVKDYRELGEALWDRFNAGPDEILWYYRSLADVFLAFPADASLAGELGVVVTELEGLVRQDKAS